VALADAGRAAMPGFPADLFLNWMMLAAALGGEFCRSPVELCEPGIGLEAIAMLARLAEKMPGAIYGWNPIALAERMTRTDEIPFCAFAYSYNNYCRPGFADRPLRYASLPALDGGAPLRSVVGGTGIAIGAGCRHPDAALDYAAFTASARVQAGIYASAGGQPSHRAAWDDPALDALLGGFLGDTRRDQEAAIVRPRYEGFVPLQEEAGVPLQTALRRECSPRAAWEKMNALYRAGLPPGFSAANPEPPSP
jgi:multiple sugar transport system substrate-binding protein